MPSAERQGEQRMTRRRIFEKIKEEGEATNTKALTKDQKTDLPPGQIDQAVLPTICGPSTTIESKEKTPRTRSKDERPRKAESLAVDSSGLPVRSQGQRPA